MSWIDQGAPLVIDDLLQFVGLFFVAIAIIIVTVGIILIHLIFFISRSLVSEVRTSERDHQQPREVVKLYLLNEYVNI